MTKTCCEKCKDIFLKSGEVPIFRCLNINCPNCHSVEAKECNHDKELICRKCAEAVGEGDAYKWIAEELKKILNILDHE